MSTPPYLPNHVVIPFRPGEPLTFPVCEFHINRIKEYPEVLYSLELGREEYEAVDEAIECGTYSFMVKPVADACELCKGFYRDLHAT